jgi:hypothetical protein
LEKNLKFSEVGKEAGDQIASLLKIITMDQAKIADEYNIEKLGKQFLLTPKDKAKAFFESSTLQMNAKGLVEKVVIKEKSQDEIHLQFVELVTKNMPPAKDLKCLR